MVNNNSNSNSNSNSNIKQSGNKYNVVEELQDYMFTSKNLTFFSRNMFDSPNSVKVGKNNNTNNKNNSNNTNNICKSIQTPIKNNYKPRHQDSLFWCFYILKYGLSKYEMEVGNQHFTIEKTEKFKYIDMLRKNKDILKINKIRPLTDLEDDLANKQRISVKTFFALCILEKVNILLVDKQKIYESINNDESEIHVVHRNGLSNEHWIEFNMPPNEVTRIRETYYKITGFEAKIKSISSYTINELLELCKQLGINTTSNMAANAAKKITKKDIYEQIIQNF
jgi:hypothetical protein